MYEGAVILSSEQQPQAPPSPVINVYPNPADSFINVETNAERVEVIDILGRVVLRAAGAEQIVVSNLPVGVYVVRAAGKSHLVSVRR